MFTRSIIEIALLLAVISLAGCGGETSGPVGVSAAPQPAPVRRPAARSDRQAQKAAASRKPADRVAAEPTAPVQPASQPDPHSLADLLHSPGFSSDSMLSPRIAVDEARVAAAGVRKLAGERLILFTDLPAQPEIDTLPAAFDQAFPQWCEYFKIDPAQHADWQMTGFLIQDKELFRQLGLLPDYLPQFGNGYSRNYNFWLYEQPSDYYRRHLVLHEGTHGLMNTILGGCGPAWYMEGIAELLATHRWKDARLELNVMPLSRDEVPMWGRIKIIKDGYAAREAWRVERVLQYAPENLSETDPYAWCWGLATMLDGHPAYRERFRRIAEMVTAPDFTDRFQQLFADDWAGLLDQWQVFVADLEYGYDVARAAVDFTPGKPLAHGGTAVTAAADRGWQNSGLRLEAGKTYRLRASGRYQVADKPQVWWCEPGGVSIRYYQGRPLGMLLAAVRPDEGSPDGPTPLTRPTAIGLQANLTPDYSGTLYLKINDSAAELHDNAGTLEIHISPLNPEP